MRHMPTVSEIMTAFPLHIDEQAELSQAAEMMDQHSCHHLPVVAQHQVVGLLSMDDVMRGCEPGHDAAEITDLLVKDMYQPAQPVEMHTRLDVVLEAMIEQQTDTVVVVRQQRLAGILTSRDIYRGFARWLQKEYLPSDDPSIA